jgi:hypothetical protein
MTSFARAATLTAILLVAACAPYTVRTDFEPTGTFATLKTYAWIDSTPVRRDSLRNASPFLEQRLRRAVDKAFEGRGYHMDTVAARADFLVSAFVVGPSRSERSQRMWASYHCPVYAGVSFGIGYYPYGFSRRAPWYRYPSYYRWDPWGYACSYRLGYGYVWVPIYERPDGLDGTLVIDVFNRATKQLMWRGSAKGALFDREPGRSQQELDDIVGHILAKFPPYGP